MTTYTTDAPNAPAAVGPYSQAVTAGNLVFLSGQIGLDPKSGAMVTGGIEAEANQVLSNLKAVLEHLRLGFSNVVQARIYLANFSDYAVVNKIYEKWLGNVKPARATVGVAALPKNALVEIEMLAVK